MNAIETDETIGGAQPEEAISGLGDGIDGCGRQTITVAPLREGILDDSLFRS
nr:hypothetical protein [Edaphobacter modestus]